MYIYKLIVPAIAAATLGACTLSSASHDDNRDLYGHTGYAPAYGQPAYGQPGYQPSAAYNPAQGPVYQQPANAPLASTAQMPNTGQWQWGTTPNGYRTRIWIPDGSWKNGPAQSAFAPQADQPPRYSELYKSSHGRYDTIRFPDGRLEHEWRADEPSTPLQGYWQIVQSPNGTQRVWVTGVEGTAIER